MKEKRTGKTSVKERTDWNRLRSLSDRQIRRAIESDPEARPTDAEFWKKARVVIPAPKQTITIRLDADLLEWLRKQKGYQTRINAVLRTFMDANLTSGRRA
ncbi:MAG: BrnA antitoxin family protein [Bryobacteraceae bacterium]